MNNISDRSTNRNIVLILPQVGTINWTYRVMYKDKDGQIIFTGQRDPVDINDLPTPRYEMLDMDDYIYRQIITSEGIIL